MVYHVCCMLIRRDCLASEPGRLPLPVSAFPSPRIASAQYHAKDVT